MGNLYISTGGGGGIMSDDVNATKSDVLKGTYTITSDSNDEVVEGTLELTGNAATANVLATKTFYNTNAKSIQTGSMKNKAGTSTSATVDESGSSIRMKLPESGYYDTNAYLTSGASVFGDAAAAYVYKDKTFTSSAGLKVKGTMTITGISSFL